MKRLSVLLLFPIMALAFVGYVSAGVPNPAAVYCGLMGGDSQVVTAPDGGQHSMCVFSDVTCDVWDFYKGLCGVNHSYCAQHGYNLVVLNDGKDPFSNPYAACADPTTGALICPTPPPGTVNIPVVCSVGGLLNLPDLLTRGLCPGCTPVIGAPSKPTAPMAPLAAPPDPLPSSFDWRNYNGSNWMTSVKDQSQCGSCWFFSAVGAVEAAYNIANNNPNLALNLAEEYGVANCNSNGDGGCCGGFNDHALAAIRDHGVPDEVCMPYNVADYGTGTCNCYPNPPCNTGPSPPMCPNGAGTSSCADSHCSDACSNVASRLVKIKDYHSAGSDTNTMKQNLINHGPLSVCLNIDGTVDTNGVTTCTSSATNHCVVITGYDDSISAWAIKNSWGSNDGPNHDGYRKIGYDQCGINSSAYWVETTQLPFPDLAVTITCPSSSGVNENLTCTVTVANNGQATATGVQFTFTVPAATQFVSASATCIGPTNGPGDGSCNLPDIPVGSNQVATLVFRPVQQGTFSTTVTATGALPDLNPANNTATATTTIAQDCAPGNNVCLVSGMKKTPYTDVYSGDRLEFGFFDPSQLTADCLNHGQCWSFMVVDSITIATNKPVTLARVGISFMPQHPDVRFWVWDAGCNYSSPAGCSGMTYSGMQLQSPGWSGMGFPPDKPFLWNVSTSGTFLDQATDPLCRPQKPPAGCGPDNALSCTIFYPPITRDQATCNHGFLCDHFYGSSPGYQGLFTIETIGSIPADTAFYVSFRNKNKFDDQLKRCRGDFLHPNRGVLNKFLFPSVDP